MSKTRIATLLLMVSPLFFAASCPIGDKGPNVKVYVSRPSEGGLIRSQTRELILYEDSGGMRAMTQRDFDALLNYCLSPGDKVSNKWMRKNLIHNINTRIETE